MSKNTVSNKNGKTISTPEGLHSETCNKCKKNIIGTKDTLRCAGCNSIYDFDCAGLSEKLYRLMKPESKKKWKCKSCIHKPKQLHSPSKVTLRRKTNATISKSRNITALKQTSAQIDGSPNTIQTATSEESLASPKELTMYTPAIETDDERQSDDSHYGMLSRSADLTYNNTQETQQLKIKIDDLTSLLASTQKELENTILENITFQKEISKLTTKIELLEAICREPPSKKIKQRRQSIAAYDLSTTPVQLKTLNHCRKSQTSFYGSHTNEKIPKITFLQNKITQLEEDLAKALEEIVNLNEEITALTYKLKTGLETPLFGSLELLSNIRHKTQEPGKEYSDNAQVYTTDKHTRKLCVISSSRRYNILHNIRNNESFNGYQVCHFITANVGIEILLRDIDIKLKEYSMEDFCVVLIGEADFNVSQDYKTLITSIKMKLHEITNTNIILVTPTYICGKSLYNYRVEIFNKLLNQDMATYKYGSIIDSNRNLTLDMFSSLSGKIMNNGVKVILQDVLELMVAIKIQYKQTSVIRHERTTQTTNTLQEDQFFL